MVLQFFCSLCNQDYGSADEVVSTRCGHVFHGSCLRGALTRSHVCPSCQASCNVSDISKVFITCHNWSSSVTDEDNLKLKAELDACLKSTSELKLRLNEAEENFLLLHQELDAVQSGRQSLLQEKQYLEVVRQSLQEELNDKRVENSDLKQKLEEIKQDIAMRANQSSIVVNNDMNCSGLAAELVVKNRQIETLKKELNDKTLELEKEIRNSANLNIEKMRLQQLINVRMDDNAFQRTTFAMGESLQAELFKYAKKLYRYGFKNVFIENNQVYVKTYGNAVNIKIASKQQVDEMIKKYNDFSLNVRSPINN